MKIAIVYATYTGSTYLIAEQIEKILKGKFETTVIKAEQTTPLDLSSYDCVLFGAPSWYVSGLEGMPPETLLELLKKIQIEKHFPRTYGVFGPGDRSFNKFCGAVDYTDAILRSLGSRRVGQTLKLDSYFTKVDENTKLILEWSENIKKELSKI